MVMEVLSNLPPIANQIRSGNLHQIYSTMQTLKKEGLSTLEDHLIDLVRDGSVRREDALRLANDPRDGVAERRQQERGQFIDVDAAVDLRHNTKPHRPLLSLGVLEVLQQCLSDAPVAAAKRARDQLASVATLVSIVVP